MKKGDFMLHWSLQYFWYNQTRRPLDRGGGVGEFLLRKIIALLSNGTNTNIGQKKWTKDIAFYLFTIPV